MLTAWILLVFAAGAAAMVLRVVPALLALPLMALGILAGATLFGDVGYAQLFGSDGVLTTGTIRLHKAMIVALLGGVLSFLMQRSGAAERMVKTGAELGGEHPFGIALSVLLLVTLLFTTIGGLGAIVMVSMIVLPILGTVGVGPLAAAGILLFGISLGGLLNPGNWVLYTGTLEVPLEDVQRFATLMFSITAAIASLFVGVELRRAGAIHSWFGVAAASGGVGLGCAALAFAMRALRAAGDASDGAPGLLQWLLVGIPLGLLVTAVLLDLRGGRDAARGPSWQTFFIPVVPLLTILALGMDPIAGFVVGIAYAWLSTLRQGERGLLVRALLEGGGTVLPAVVLMFGIGLLVTAALGPAGADPGSWPVQQAIRPLLVELVPESALGYVLAFGLLAPLALYRGPLNLYGLGFGVAVILTEATALPATAVMGVLMSVGMVQGVSDPTNTQNVWLANELRVDVQTVMMRTLPFTWGLAFLGLIVSAVIHLGDAA